MDEVKITQEQQNKGDGYIQMFQQLKALKQDYPKAYDFLKSTFVPDYSYNDVQVPSLKTIRHKVLAEIYLADEVELLSIQNSPKK